MSSQRLLSQNHETLLDFLNTHLAMVAFLMPWKKITVDVGTGAALVSTNHLWTLFDFLNVDKWMVGAGKTDDSLTTKTHTLIALSVTLLFTCILSFASGLFYAKDTGVRFGLDFVNFSLGAVLLVLAITFQTDFDAFWKHAASSDPAGTKTDYEQMFMVIGILTGQVFLSLVSMGDKFAEIRQKYL